MLFCCVLCLLALLSAWVGARRPLKRDFLPLLLPAIFVDRSAARSNFKGIRQRSACHLALGHSLGGAGPVQGSWAQQRDGCPRAQLAGARRELGPGRWRYGDGG